MNEFSAEKFYRLGILFQNFKKEGVKWQEEHPGGVLVDTDIASLHRMIGDALDLAASVGLKITSKLLADAITAAEEGKSPARFVELITTAHEVIEREMDGELFLYVPSTRSAYYHGGTSGALTQDTLAVFMEADRDARESGNAFACGLYTACVFHLMRIMERGLHAVSLSLKLVPAKNPNWSHHIAKFERESIEKNPTANALWMANQAFYNSVRSTLCAVKDAWRNETMHVDRDYDETEAEEIIFAVRAFMRHLASRMDEKGAMT